MLSNLNAVNYDELYLNLKDFGVNKSKNEVNNSLKNIISNLKIILKNKKDIQDIQSVYKQFFAHSGFSDNDKYIVFPHNNMRIEICNLNLSVCSLKEVSKDEYVKLLSGGLTSSNGKSYIFIGDKNSYVKGGYKYNSKIDFKKIKIGDTDVLLYGSPKVKFNQKDKIILIEQKEVKDKVVFFGGNLSNWSVKFIGTDKKLYENSQRFDENLLTGCITFLDIELDGIDIDISNSLCEDAVNFLRVFGNINKVSIKNSLSDAIDADFSSLEFKEIVISNAGNDCLDFSGGRYEIISASLNDCKDKAISAGEKSTLFVNNLVVNDATIGIAAKDSSIVTVNKSSFNEVNLCLSAYKKKQEFWGGEIKVNKHNCTNNSIYLDRHSSIYR